MGENQSDEAKSRRRASGVVGLVLAMIVLPFMIPMVVCFFLYSVLLRLSMWAVYCTRGTNVLFVSSNSPIWEEHLEEHVVPYLPDSALRLNWSERTQWNWRSLRVRIFNHFAGDHAYNPLAIVFSPFRKTKVFRFWQPFRDFKNGKTEPLEAMEEDLLNELHRLK